MLFHLAHPFIRGRGPIQVEGALERLVDRHGNGNYLDCTLKLTFPRHPDGLYLIKGSGSDVWQRFRVPPKWRKPQGLIHGKRCGTTQNIGASAQKHRCQSELTSEVVCPVAVSSAHSARRT
jgi:hypothetical protein